MYEDNLSWVNSLFGNAAQMVAAVKGNTKTATATPSATSGLPKWLLPVGIGVALLLAVVLIVRR